MLQALFEFENFFESFQSWWAKEKKNRGFLEMTFCPWIWSQLYSSFICDCAFPVEDSAAQASFLSSLGFSASVIRGGFFFFPVIDVWL